ncbi:hypothetical protein Avbf_17491, partial [Armadillidium vulgare]
CPTCILAYQISINDSFELDLTDSSGIPSTPSIIGSGSKCFTLWQSTREGASSTDSYSIVSSLSRSGSQGSGGTYSEAGSLERTGGRTGIPSDNNKDPRVVSTREDAHDMIDQIFQDNIGSIRPDDSAE